MRVVVNRVIRRLGIGRVDLLRFWIVCSGMEGDIRRRSGTWGCWGKHEWRLMLSGLRLSRVGGWVCWGEEGSEEEDGLPSYANVRVLERILDLLPAVRPRIRQLLYCWRVVL